MSTSVDRNEAQKVASREVFVIFVGDIEEKWRDATITADRIMREAGVSNPEKFILEALDNKGGNPVAEFTSADSVNLADKDRKFFRITPGGGGRS